MIKKIAVAVLLGMFMVTSPALAVDNALMTPEFNETTYSPEPPATVSYVDDSWTPWNIGAFSFMAFGNAADVWSTQDALDRGLTEANPLYGDDPSVGQLVLTKVIYMGLIYYITEYHLVPSYGTNARNWTYGISGAVGTAACIWNVNQ